MANLLGISTTAIGIIGGIVGVIVLSVIMHYINRSYRIKYNYNLFGGGFFMLLAEGGIAVGILAMNGTLEGNLFLYGGFGLAALLILIIAICNFKRCGFGAGLGALFLQIIFSVPCLFLLVELFSGKSLPTTNYREEQKIREERKKRGYDR